MIIKVKNDFRNLKAGDKFDFSVISDIKAICVVGENGCGKSSIFQALRGLKNDSKTSSLYESDFEKLAVNIEVEHKYEKIFYYDNVKDDGQNFMVGFDAVNFVTSGGLENSRRSHGEGSLGYLAKFIHETTPKIVAGKTLIVFDEVDNGFSIKNMSKFVNVINNLMHQNVEVIVISHNPFLMNDMRMVYDFEKKDLELSSRYIKEQTGFILNDKKK